MSEAYCGKNCAECMRREELNCPGCKAGPGRSFGGDCEISKCMRSKGHESCSTCAFHTTCGSLRGKDSMPDHRIRRLEADEQRKAAIAKRAPVLGKWLWLIFWLLILQILLVFLTNGNIMSVDTPAATVGQIISAVVSFVSGVAFLKMAAEEEHYRSTGICFMIAAGINLVIELIPGIGEVILLLIAIPAAIVGVVGEYHEYKAHSAVLTGIDNILSEKWETLWKWYIGLFGGLFGSLLLILLIPTLGALIALGTTIGVLVVSVRKMVYLYRTMKIFREYPG